MQGSKFLKVTGILMIIFGALALVLAIIAIAGISLLAAMALPAACSPFPAFSRSWARLLNL